MSLFDKVNSPVFIKEDCDARKYISDLELLKENSTGELKEKIEKEIKIASIGLYGEDNVAFELKNCDMGIYIIRDLHIKSDDLSAQIDFIVVTRKFNLFIECKNMIGDIEIDKHGNFIRTYSYKGQKIREGIYSPITQNQRHLDVMKKLKISEQSNRLMSFAMEKLFDGWNQSVVVLANPKTILNDHYAPKDIKSKVIRADQLSRYIKQIYKSSKESPSNDKDFLKFAERLVSRHQPQETDYLKKYHDLLAEHTNQESQTSSVVNSNNANNTTNKENPILNKEKLFEELRIYRLERSRAENVKPYFIFNNSQLEHLIEIMPQNKADLIKVNGFGEVKTEKYGDEILSIISRNAH